MNLPSKKPQRRSRRVPAQGRRYSIAEARNQLARLVHDSEQGPHIELTRRGQPVAVILSAAAYQRLTETPDLMTRIEQFRAQHDLDALDAGEAFTVRRARSSGRRFTW